MTNSLLSRRNILRGAGVALSLPWLESLAPKHAAAATATVPVRYLPIYLPNGAPLLWSPSGSGSGTAWQLSSILQPLAALKSKVTIISNLENGSVFNMDGSSSVEPSHGRQPGAWLTGMDAGTVRAKLNVEEANGVSVDQIMAAHALFSGKTALPSLAVGLSTVYSSCDGEQCSNARSVSWRTPIQPLFKTVDPLLVFNALVAAKGGNSSDADAAKRLARRKSVLDTVLENASNTRTRLSVADRLRMDEFLDSVRSVEKRVVGVSGGMGGAACALGAAPTLATVTPDNIRQNSATYNKGTHADAMNDLIVLAFQCDLTRIITYMLEDERSEFTYDHVERRVFGDTGSTGVGGTCGEYHGFGQHGQYDDYCTITWWNVAQVASLCSKLDAIKEANGLSILDNSLVYFGACMHSDDHACDRIPTAIIGSAGGKLKTDQHLVLEKTPMRNLHYTVMNDVFGMNQANFGQNLTGAPIANVPQILA